MTSILMNSNGVVLSLHETVELFEGLLAKVGQKGTMSLEEVKELAEYKKLGGIELAIIRVQECCLWESIWVSADGTWYEYEFSQIDDNFEPHVFKVVVTEGKPEDDELFDFSLDDFYEDEEDDDEFFDDDDFVTELED